MTMTATAPPPRPTKNPAPVEPGEWITWTAAGHQPRRAFIYERHPQGLVIFENFNGRTWIKALLHHGPNLRKIGPPEELIPPSGCIQHGGQRIDIRGGVKESDLMTTWGAPVKDVITRPAPAEIPLPTLPPNNWEPWELVERPAPAPPPFLTVEQSGQLALCVDDQPAPSTDRARWEL